MATSGIGISTGLTQTFASAVEPNGTVRFIKISIENETLVPSDTIEVDGSLDEDLPKLQEVLDDATPSYVLVKLDAPEVGWLAISYVPDEAKVRDKMLYASTRNALTKSLGAPHFTDTLFATSKADLTPESYAAHKRHSSAPAPLSAREKEQAEAAAAERAAGLSVYQGAGERRSHVSGAGGAVGLNWTEDAEEGVKALGSEEGAFAVVLSIDVPMETVTLAKSQAAEADDLGALIPSSEPSYTLFSWPNTLTNSREIVFIYSCPSSSPIKPRMLYSSASGPVYHQVASILASSSSAAEDAAASSSLMTPPKLHSRKVETSEPSEVNAKFLMEETGRGSQATATGGTSTPLGGAGDGDKKPFARPRGPGRKR